MRLVRAVLLTDRTVSIDGVEQVCFWGMGEDLQMLWSALVLQCSDLNTLRARASQS